MAYRVLEVTIQSAKNLTRVNLITRMEVYAVVTVSGDPLTRRCTPPDPYGGRHPCWNATFRFNVPPVDAAAAGCLHVLLRTERALGDRDVGEVIVPLAELLAAADPGPRPQRCASYTVRKVQRSEPRGTLNVSYRLGPVVAVPRPARADVDHGPVVVGHPAHPSPYGYRPPTLLLPPPPPPPPPSTQVAGGHDAVRQHSPSPSAGSTDAYNNDFPARSQSTGAHLLPAPSTMGPAVNTYNNNPAATGYAAALPPTRGGNRDDGKVDFGVGLGAGLVSGAIGGMLASDMVAEAAAYGYGYRAGLADGGGTAVYKNSSHVPKAQD